MKYAIIYIALTLVAVHATQAQTYKEAYDALPNYEAAARKAVQAYNALPPDSLDAIKSAMLAGSSYTRLEMYDSAAYYLWYASQYVQDTKLKADIDYWQAETYERAGMPEHTIKFANKAIDGYVAVKNSTTLSQVHITKGLAYLQTNNYDSAKASFARSIRISNSIKGKNLYASSLLYFGPEEKAKGYELLKSLIAETEDTEELAWVLNNAGRGALMLGDNDQARQYFTRAIALGGPARQVAYLNLSKLAASESNPIQAAAYADSAARVYYASEHNTTFLPALKLATSTFEGIGHDAKALALHTYALPIHEERSRQVEALKKLLFKQQINNGKLSAEGEVLAKVSEAQKRVIETEKKFDILQYIGIGLLIICIAGIILFYRVQRKKREIEAENMKLRARIISQS